MKAKSVTFRPRADLAERLDKLAELSERNRTWLIEKCVEGHLPVLESRYLSSGDVHRVNKPALARSAGDTKAATSRYPAHKPAAHTLNEPKRK